jgi:hypothetical protein
MSNKYYFCVLMLALSAPLVFFSDASSSVPVKKKLTNEDANIFVLEVQQELEKLQLPSAQAA